LLEAGLITRTQLDLALDRQQGDGQGRPRLGRVLVDLGLLAEEELTKILGVHLAIRKIEAHAVGSDQLAGLETLERRLFQFLEDHERLARNVLAVQQERKRLIDEHRGLQAELDVMQEQARDLLSALTDFTERLATRYGSALSGA
jgi:methyl-accepting chemotaxis protein